MGRLLIETGKALYGERWQCALAKDLDISDRTMRRWVAGDDAPRPGVYVDLLRLATERIAVLEGLTDRLKEAGS